MKQLIIDKLVEIGVFNQNSISKEEYEKHDSKEGNMIYRTTEFEWGTENIETRYWETDTQNLTDEEINLLLNIDKANSLRSIKKGVIFFVVLSVISIIISIIGAVNVASLF